MKIVIPARMQSTRFPGKPLVPVGGIPMVIQTAMRVAEVVSREDIVIASDSPQVTQVADAYGFSSQITSREHKTGTDRVAEVAAIHGLDYVVNVQGDEPVLPADDLRTFLSAVQACPTRIFVSHCDADEREMNDPKYVKVALSSDRVIYMSRSPVPGDKGGVVKQGNRQVGLYGFPGEALRQFSGLPSKSPCEEKEDVEALRFLELGFDVYSVRLSAGSMSVDRPRDVALVEAILAAGHRET